MSQFDVLIIGGGPAGLSAATSLVRQLHTVVVFDSGAYRNGISRHLHNMATWDHKDPADFRKIAKQDLLARYKTVTFEDTEITSVEEMPDGFHARDQSGNIWKGRKVILASGVRDILPDIPGFADGWGQKM